MCSEDFHFQTLPYSVCFVIRNDPDSEMWLPLVCLCCLLISNKFGLPAQLDSGDNVKLMWQFRGVVK